MLTNDLLVENSMEHHACNELNPGRKAPQAAIGQVLIEALPYIRKFEGKTFVIKYGGSANEGRVPEKLVRTECDPSA